MSANSPRPWKMALPLAAAAAAAALWSIYWAAALHLAQGEIASARAKQAERGITLKCTEESWGGYPFRFEYSCAHPTATHDGRFGLVATELRAVAMAYKPWHLITFVTGPTDITLPGQSPLSLIHEPVQASIIAQSTTSGRFTADISGLDAGGLLQADNILLSARTMDLRQADYDVRATDIKLLLPDLAPILADTLASQGTITNPPSLVITSATLQRGELTLSASGQVELDALKRPKGMITIKTNDAAKLLALLRETYHLPEQDLAALSAFLTVAGNQVTLTAADGQLYAGPLKIGELAPLLLPAGG